jgi:hypothetical protein
LEDFLKELQAHTSQTLKEFMQQTGQSTSPMSQELLLEDALNTFRQKVNQPTQELKDATLANTKAIAKLKGQIDHLVAKFNRIKKNELQSQKMARGKYMIHEDDISNPHHEHVQATTTRGSEEIVDETVSELSLEDLEVKCFTQDGDNLNLDKLLGQAGIFVSQIWRILR